MLLVDSVEVFYNTNEKQENKTFDANDPEQAKAFIEAINRKKQ